jgi:hypothetical protein
MHASRSEQQLGRCDDLNAVVGDDVAGCSLARPAVGFDGDRSIDGSGNGPWLPVRVLTDALFHH